jgi:hypothetical protein
MPPKIARFFVIVGILALLLASGWATAGAAGPDTVDEINLAIDRQVPGFGGAFVENDTLTVYLTNLEGRPAAERALAAAFGAEGLRGRGIQVRQGQYGFSQLKTWQDEAGAVFDLPGVVFTDVDETLNRVAIGVENKAAGAAVTQALMRLQIPLKAVEIVEAPPILQLETLRGKVRPLQGGLQINFSGYLCTYGFNATRGGFPGFVTNSHCTSKQGDVESTQYWQPTQTIDSTVIGVETADPTYSRTKCPPTIKGKVCRWSDSAFVRLNTAEFALGEIARTESVNTGSLDIAGSFAISGTGTHRVGDTVNKVGRTSGWSQGRVTRTCVDTGVSGSNIVQLCQTWVSATVGSGDSGSPVFSGSNRVALQGLLWGGSADNRTFIFSPMANITRADELGDLTVR